MREEKRREEKRREEKRREEELDHLEELDRQADREVFLEVAVLEHHVPGRSRGRSKGLV